MNRPRSHKDMSPCKGSTKFRRALAWIIIILSGLGSVFMTEDGKSISPFWKRILTEVLNHLDQPRQMLDSSTPLSRSEKESSI